MPYFESRRVGDTVARVRELENIRHFLTGTPLSSMIDLMFMIVYFAVMYFYSPKLTLVVFISIPLYVILSLVYTPIFRKRLQEKFTAGAESQPYIVETITGINTIKAMAIEPIMQQKWESLLAKYTATGYKTSILSGNLNAIANLMQKIFDLIILWMGAMAVINGNLTVGMFVAFRMLSSRVSSPVLRLVSLWQEFQQTSILFIIVAITWSCLCKVDVVATSTGQIAPNGDVKVVQPFEQGIVTKIHVEDGQHVTAGDSLVDLDTGIKDVSINTSNQQLDEYVTEEKALKDLISGKSLSELTKNTDDSNKYIIDYINTISKLKYRFKIQCPLHYTSAIDF